MNNLVKMNYYSERGMVNAICQSMYRYKSSAFHFLKLIKNINGKQMFDYTLKSISEIHIFNEFSFGDFGDPDLILKINFIDNTKPVLIFIEAKVGTYKNSAKTSCFEKESYKNNASRINFQLRLKKRFIDALYNDDEFVEDTNMDNEYDYKCRYFKKMYLVKYIKEYIFKGIKKDNIYYVTMTSDEKNPFSEDGVNLPFIDSEDELKRLGYVLYKDILNETKKGEIISNDRIVLYNDTSEMFKVAYALAKNKRIDEYEAKGEE